MSRLPQIRRLLVEDFLEQKDWISKLFTPLNTFMDGVNSSLSRGISLRDNMAADVKVITLDSVPTAEKPARVQWSLPVNPIAVHVGNVQNPKYTNFTLAAAVQVQWIYDATGGLRLTNVIGITPTTASQYILTLVIFTG